LAEEADDDDDRFLPSSAKEGHATTTMTGSSNGGGADDRASLKEGEVYLSAEVRALMAQCVLPSPAIAPPFLSFPFYPH
jgi:hypothetical protein